MRRPCPCPPAPVLGPRWPKSPLHWSCYRPLPVRQGLYSPDPNPFNLTHGNPLSRPSIPLGKPREAPSAVVPSARKDDTPSDEFIPNIFSDGNFFEDFFACDPFFAPAYTGALSAPVHALSVMAVPQACSALSQYPQASHLDPGPLALRHYFFLSDFPPPMPTSADALGATLLSTSLPALPTGIPPPTYCTPTPSSRVPPLPLRSPPLLP